MARSYQGILLKTVPLLPRLMLCQQLDRRYVILLESCNSENAGKALVIA
jgi:hypothetical protein